MSLPLSEGWENELKKTLDAWRKWVFQQGVVGYNKNPSTQNIEVGDKKELSTEVVSPVRQPALFYPALFVGKPRRKDFLCPSCGSTNRSSLSSRRQFLKSEGELYGFGCGWCGRQWFVSSRLILNEILEDQLNRVTKFTKETEKEFGAMILRTEKGIVLDMIQIGKEREISFALSRKLGPDEELLGSFHAHPITDFPSFWDLATFLANVWEQISFVAGAEGHLTGMVKTNETVVLGMNEVESWEKTHREAETPIEQIAKEYKFLLYRGTPSSLRLVGGGAESSTTLERLVAGIQGVKQI